MGLSKTIWTNPSEFLRIERPVDPVMFFAPAVLQDPARRFLDGFPGLVTYAVKSNPDEMVIQNLVAAGIEGFDVASPAEIEMIARLAPTAAMHYNNPVRARHEIAFAVDMGVRSYSVDSRSELAKLIELVPAAGTEISVRFKLPVTGAAYNFGAKFGATVELAAELLREVAAAGFIPSLTFHPGTQCTDPMAWDAYIRAAAEICRMAGVRAQRLNTGGGFPAHRVNGELPQLEPIFALIGRVAGEAFAGEPPALVCEPGRGLDGGAQNTPTREDGRARLAKAEAMFAERCKKSGEFIHRTAENVEGIFLMKIRPNDINYGDQYKLDDPYGRDFGGDAYIRSLLRDFFEANYKKPMFQGLTRLRI